MTKWLLATFVATLAAVAVHGPAPACAKQLVWKGGDMNFDNENNWEGAVPLEGSDVASVDLRSEQPYTSYIHAETYSVGSRMKLPMNGRFVFQGDDSVVIKFKEQATGPAAQFKGPRDDIDFDFNCPNNWRLWRGSAEHETADPPRGDDSVFFESGNAYYVFSDAPLTNVDEFAIGDGDELLSTTPDPTTIDRCSDLPAYQFAGLDCSRFFIDDESACVDEMSFFDEVSDQRECMYYNSCPTEVQEAEQRARQIEATAYAGTLLEQELAVEAVVDFSFDVPLALLAGTDEVQDVVHTALQNDDVVGDITQAILADLNSTLFSWAVTSFTASYASDSTTLTLDGNVRGERRHFVLAGADPRTFDATAKLTLPSDPSQAGAFHTETRVLARIHVATHAARHAEQQAQTVLDDNCPSDNAGTCSQLADLARSVDALETAIEGPALGDDVPTMVDLAAVLAAVCPDGVCPTDLASVTAALVDALGGANVTDALPAGTLDSVAASLAGLNTTAAAGVTAFVASDDFSAIGSMLNTAEVAARQAQLTTQTFTTAPIVFGHNLPALTLQLLVNTDHSDAFAAGFAQPFLSTANADSVDNVQLSLVDATSSFSGSGSSSSTRRRRASASNDEEGMMVLAEVVVTYTATCLEDECDALVVTEASPKYPVLRDAANAAAASLDPRPYQCFVSSVSGSVVLVDTLPEEQCLLEAARTLLAGNGGDVTAAFDALFGDTGCGPAGALEDGSCVLSIASDERAQIETRVRNAVNAATTTTTTTEAATKGPGVSSPTSTTTSPQTISTNKSTGAASSVGAIAGGAAAGLIAVVAVILLLVVVRRRGGPSDKGKASAADPNRHVVAFENPMYDDPGVTGSGLVQPAYEAAAGDGDGQQEEGLYDEPAFALNSKANPIYQSNDALNAEEEGEYDVMYAFDGEEEDEDEDGGIGGYLDVAPEEE